MTLYYHLKGPEALRDTEPEEIRYAVHYGFLKGKQFKIKAQKR